jgi:hypothetical protein
VFLPLRGAVTATALIALVMGDGSFGKAQIFPAGNTHTVVLADLDDDVTTVGVDIEDPDVAPGR